MQSTRREFIRLGLGTSALLACGPTVPMFLVRSAYELSADPRPGSQGRILVVLQLDGGNDGLNTIVPYKDDAYHKHRPKLHLSTGEMIKIDDRLAFHRALTGFAKLLDNRQLAIVQSVGYPNPDRSHFTSMAIWQTARREAKADTPGWLARILETKPEAAKDAAALHIGSETLPQALTGSRRHVPSLDSLEQFRRRIGISDAASLDQQKTALDQIVGRRRGAPDSLLQFVEQSAVSTYATSACLEGILREQADLSDYPDFGLARRLKLIAQLIKADLGTPIYYTRLGNFDTHANQLNTHSGLLQEVASSLRAFLEDVNKSGDAGRVLVLVFSEFGRRLAENASGGTDHGTAAPVFLLGQNVKPGLHGPYPNLEDLQDGDPKHAIDFRRVYATLLDRWLGCPSAQVLGEKFEHLPAIRDA